MLKFIIFVSCLTFAFGNNNSTILTSWQVIATAGSFSQTPSPVVQSVTTSMSSANSTVNYTSYVSVTPSMPSTMMLSSSMAPKPTPTPTPNPYGNYSVKNKEGYCLLARLFVSFNITYYQNKTDNKNTTILVKAFTLVNMPIENFTTDGSKCDTKASKLVINWPKQKPLYHFQMNFIKTKTNSVSGWEVDELSLDLSTTNNPHFKNANETTIKLYTQNETELKAISGKYNGSYVCNVNKSYPFHEQGSLFLTYAQLLPFDVTDKKYGTDFGTENNCNPEKPKPAPKNNNIVPIAVGCALAGLVLIVLIAYIIGRRKTQRGYEKV